MVIERSSSVCAKLTGGQGLDCPPFDSIWGLDSEKAAHDEKEGKTIAEYVLSWLDKLGLSIPTDAKYLGLGAGMAYPELAFARTLGIAASNITLLDINFGRQALIRIKNVSPEIAVFDRIGIWSFLKNPNVGSFSVVSLFGLDHKLRDWSTLHIVLNLPKILTSNALVCIFPGGNSELGKLWEQQEFLILNNGVLQTYLFQPKEIN